MPPVKPLEDLWDRVSFGDWLDCWEWTGARDPLGYGRITHRELTSSLVHRATYELLAGPIPEGLDLDHLCRNPPCCNPLHLEPVTRRENQLRGYGAGGMNARKTHCKHGHPFDEGNTYVYKGRRSCRLCKRISNRLSDQRRRAARDA